MRGRGYQRGLLLVATLLAAPFKLMSAVSAARAVLAAVRGGYVDSLVTHSTLATALIDAASTSAVRG